MPLEIEGKMKVENLDGVRRRLIECGAQRGGTVLETNIFFDTPDSSLVSHDKGLRLRTSRDQQTGELRHVATLKGPSHSGSLKSRQEIEFSLDKPEAFIEMLKEIGYQQILSFEKRRESWKLDDCQIELDELPMLGSFVEIEGPGEQCVMQLREKLGLANRPLIPTSYATMLARQLELTGQRVRTVTFESVKRDE